MFLVSKEIYYNISQVEINKNYKFIVQLKCCRKSWQSWLHQWLRVWPVCPPGYVQPQIQVSLLIGQILVSLLIGKWSPRETLIGPPWQQFSSSVKYGSNNDCSFTAKGCNKANWGMRAQPAIIIARCTNQLTIHISFAANCFPGSGSISPWRTFTSTRESSSTLSTWAKQGKMRLRF